LSSLRCRQARPMRIQSRAILLSIIWLIVDRCGLSSRSNNPSRCVYRRWTRLVVDGCGRRSLPLRCLDIASSGEAATCLALWTACHYAVGPRANVVEWTAAGGFWSGR
jgi:hypothetical protein